MAARPTQLPEWATGAEATVVPPSAGKKALGWITDERPLAQYVNWILFTIYSWLGYLDNGERRVRVGAASGHSIGGLWNTPTGYSALYTGATTTQDWWIALPLKAGDTLTSLDFNVRPRGATYEITCAVHVYNGNTLVFSDTKDSTSGSVSETVDISVSDTANLPHTLAADEMVYVSVGASGAGAALARYFFWLEYVANVATE